MGLTRPNKAVSLPKPSSDGKIYILIIVLCLFAGCADKTTNDGTLQEIFFDEEAELRNDAPSYEFIPLETGEENLLGDIAFTIVVNNKIIVVDRYSIQVYDMHGKFISRVGSRGQGPGEYLIPQDVWVDKAAQTILIHGANYKLSVYDLNTYQYLFSKSTPGSFTSFSLLSDGSYAWYCSAGFKNDDSIYQISITDSLQRVKYSYPRDYYFEVDFLFALERFQTLSDKTYFYKGQNPIVYEITSEGAKPAYKMNFGNHSFPPLDFADSHSSATALLQTSYIGIYQFFQNDSFILSRYLWNGNRCYGIYNKKTRQTHRYADFQEDGIFKYASIEGATEDGHFVLSLQPDRLLEQKTIRIAELRELMETVSEDDNPIICLVKFN
ncbi:MAG: 6-bladed beta-propeller [Tannerella sp.]|nr:6-bladed beta-propeller [Tannerella sp.]